MKAVIYHKNSNTKELVDNRSKPSILKSTDAVVRVVHTTICGTDLHILQGHVPEVPDGLILGHEGVGVIEEIGSGVSQFKVGDKVLISCITSCGKCSQCKKQLPSHCEDGGWILGHLIDGTQAEFVRIPHADNSLYHLPKGFQEEAFVMLSDIFPTGLEIGVLNGKVSPGNTVAIVGAGPVGLAALFTAQFYSPSSIIMIDPNEDRLKFAKENGATHCINPKKDDVIKKVMEITQNQGVDVAIEVVGVPLTFDYCQQIITPGGTIAVVGVHGAPVNLQLEKLWIHNITLSTGLVNAISTSMLLKTVVSKKLIPENLITHRFKFDEMMKAYDVFTNAADHKALKVIVSH